VNSVDKVENNPTPLKRYIFLFFAILVLRLALEFFSSHRLFTFPDVMHIGLWFVFIVTAFLVQLHLFSGEEISKVIRLVIVCFTIALTAPIIDILVSWGQMSKMNYLAINSAGDILFAYLTVGGASLTRGATIGIRIEIILLVIACFNYVYTKRQSVLRGLVAAFSIYTILFLSGIIPFLLGLIVKKFNLSYTHQDQSTLLMLLLLDLVLLFIIVARRSPLKLKEALLNAPWLFSLVALGLMILGGILAILNYPTNWSLTPTTLFWFPLLAIVCFSFIVYTALAKKSATTPAAGDTFRNGVLLVLLLVGSLISARTFFSVSLLWGLLFLLYEAPLRLDTVPVLNSLLKAMAMLAASFIGFTTFGGPMIGYPPLVILGILILFFFVFEACRLFVRKAH
jgi:hypothetical protein